MHPLHSACVEGRFALLRPLSYSAHSATGTWAHNGDDRGNNHGNDHGNNHGGNSRDNDPSIPTFYPTPTRHYLKSSVNVCDQGSFFVGGMLKPTYYERSSVRSATPQVVMIGQMYVSFQIPMKFDDYPVIFVSGGAHTGASSRDLRPMAGKAGLPTRSARTFRPSSSISRDADDPASMSAPFTRASQS